MAHGTALNKEIRWRSGGFETGLVASYPANDIHDALLSVVVTPNS
jgi:hypothetical protein